MSARPLSAFQSSWGKSGITFTADFLIVVILLAQFDNGWVHLCSATTLHANDQINLRVVLNTKIKSSVHFQIIIMQIFVKTLTGKTITVEAELDSTVADVKDQICLEEDIQFNQQKLIIAGKVLDDKMTLADFGVENNSQIDLIVSMQGTVL